MYTVYVTLTSDAPLVYHHKSTPELLEIVAKYTTEQGDVVSDIHVRDDGRIVFTGEKHTIIAYTETNTPVNPSALYVYVS